LGKDKGKMFEPPITERYDGWCERTVDELIIYFLLDSTVKMPD